MDEWVLVYDREFLEDTVMDGLDDKAEALFKTVQIINERALGRSDQASLDKSDNNKGQKRSSSKSKKKVATKFKPFNLSKPRPRALPQPIKIEKRVKAAPVSEAIYKTTLKDIEREKRERLEKIKEKKKQELIEKVQPFALETHSRPTNLRKLQEEKEREEKARLQFDKKYAREVPDYGEVDVRLNQAAIMKEANAIKARQEQEEQYMKDVEVNMRDSQDFKRWIEEQKRVDKEKELEGQVKRKMEMELAKEAAIQAKVDKVEENKKNVEEVKALKAREQKRKMVKTKKDVIRKTELKKTVRKARVNVGIKKKEIFQEKVKAAEEQKEKYNLEVEYKKIEAKRQQKIRDELIRKIRELDRRVIKNTVEFDPTKITNHGLLEEMNLVELKDQLASVKKAHKKQEEKTRKKIREAKGAKNEQMRGMMDLIKEARQQRVRKNTRVRNEKKSKLQKRAERETKKSREDAVTANNNLITKKKKMKEEYDEVERLAKDIRLKKQYMNADQAKVEAQAWKNQEDGAEREIRQRQNHKMVSKYREATTKLTERQLMAEGFREEFKATLNRQKEYNVRVDEEERENELMQRQIRLTKQEQVDHLRTFKDKHSTNIHADRPYDQKINELSRTGQLVLGPKYGVAQH